MCSEIPVRTLDLKGFDEVCEEYTKTFEGLKEVMALSRLNTFDDVRNGFRSYIDKNYNPVVRCFLILNLFNKEGYYFGNVTIVDLFQPHWDYLGYRKEEIKTIKDKSILENYENFKGNLTIVVQKLLMMLIYNRTFFHNASNNFTELNYLLFECNKFDTELKQKTQPLLFQGYETALPVCSLRLELEFYLELHSKQDFAAILMTMQKIYELQHKNKSLLTQQVHTSFQRALAEGKDLSTYVDLLSDYEKRQYAEFSLLVGKEKYVLSMFKLFAWLEKYNYFPIYGEKKDFELRYNMLLKSISECMFMKVPSYSDYLEQIKKAKETDDKELLTEIKDGLNKIRKFILRFDNVIDYKGPTLQKLSKVVAVLLTLVSDARSIDVFYSSNEAWKVRSSQNRS